MNNLGAIGIACLALYLCGCEPADFKQAKTIVEKNLLRPSSVKYRHLELHIAGPAATPPFQQGMHVVCGEVKSKNLIGEYVDYKLFLAVPSVGFVSFDPGGPDPSDELGPRAKALQSRQEWLTLALAGCPNKGG